MIALTVQQIVLWCCAALLVWAAVSDLQRFIIPNGVTLGVIALYPAYVAAGFLGGMPVDWAGGLIAAAVVFAMGYVFFSIGLVGGGDVKLLTAVALFVGLTSLPSFLMVTGFAGGVLSIGILAAKMIALSRIPADLRAVILPLDRRFPILRAALKTDAPYGAAIAFGGIFIIYQLISR